MSTIKEIDMIFKIIKSQKNKEICFMNCTSEYPPIYKDINLGFIPIMKKKYKQITIGHSDHTNRLETSIAAVTLGAKIIEKHVYLDNKNYGPDRDVSISFSQFKEMVRSIRNIEQGLGKNKKIYNKEKQIRKWATRSLVAVTDIEKGKKITIKNIWSKRPGTGIPSRYINKIIGKKSKTKIKKNTLIKKSQIMGLK